MDLFYPLVYDTQMRRGLLLMGPRRVGKTVMLYHSIQKLIENGVDAQKIIYISIETPIYNRISLEELFALAREAVGQSAESKHFFVFYDEIQYLKDWEIHLKSIIDTYFYSKFMNMWGWGTWRRTAKEVDYSLSFLKKEGKTRKVLYNRLKYGFFDYDYNWINFWEAKVHEIWEKRDIDFWDYHWILNQLYFEKLSIIPAVNLVKNIGFDSNATHTLSPDHPIALRVS